MTAAQLDAIVKNLSHDLHEGYIAPSLGKLPLAEIQDARDTLRATIVAAIGQENIT